jgi:hypothetical protein
VPVDGGGRATTGRMLVNPRRHVSFNITNNCGPAPSSCADARRPPRGHDGRTAGAGRPVDPVVPAPAVAAGCRPWSAHRQRTVGAAAGRRRRARAAAPPTPSRPTPRARPWPARG